MHKKDKSEEKDACEKDTSGQNKSENEGKGDREYETNDPALP